MIPSISKLKHTDSGNFFLMAGPCVVESHEIVYEVAKALCEITDELKVPFILKASYRKANRSRLDSFTGIGDLDALIVLQEIAAEFNVPCVTDVHSDTEAKVAADYVDVLQIPAFLCRQTDILVAAAETGKFVNIKKGQFVSPQAMKFAVEKVQQSGNNNIMLTERGTMFGYNDLVVDMRSIPEMQKHKVPVIMDVTHSLQQPNTTSGVTGGLPGMISTIAKSSIAAGADGLFIETHPQPSKAKSDGANMLPLNEMRDLLKQLVRIKKALNE